MSTKKLNTSRDPKGLHAVSLFEVTYNKAKLDDDQAQRLNESPDFAAKLLELILEHSATNQYADEVEESEYTYPSEYTGPKEIAVQINLLGEMFGISTTAALAYAQNLPALPEGAEGWFAIPRVEAIGAKFFPEITDPVDRYCRAVEFVLDKLGESRSFQNYRKGQIDKKHIRGTARTIAKFGEVKQQQQDGDILIIAAQLGMKHRGKSVNRARETFSSDEYGLGAFAVISIALVHPERLVRTDELDMDCAGDDFAPDGDGDFSKSPYLIFSDDKVRFVARGLSYAFRYYGSASGFVPQPLAS